MLVDIYQEYAIYIPNIYWHYIEDVSVWFSSLSGFRGAYLSKQPVIPLDVPDDRDPDPCDDADFELPYGKALVEAFMASMAKEVNNDYRTLSQLLATLPDPSTSADPSKTVLRAEAMSFLRLGPKG